MDFFWYLFYNVILIPLGYIAILIGAIFNEKLRKGLTGRRVTRREMERFRKKYPGKELYLVHSASLGEFEQAKPVIRGLKTLRPDILIVASFTSPSGYENAVRIAEVDLFIYLPLDSYFRMRRFVQKLRPTKMIFVMYELWPNLILNAVLHHIPTFLISARIRKASLKWKPVVRSFFSCMYRSLNYVYAVSKEDQQTVRKLVGSVKIKVLALGDTRYDQVFQRARERISQSLPTLFPESPVFIAGSVWPQDTRHLFPALFRALKRHPELRLIIAPHEPNEYALETLEDAFHNEGYKTLRLSRVGKNPVTTTVVIVDRVGVLAELYHQSQIAFVGGSFRGSIHNVMEPAIAGIPVLFGPTHHNSREARLLLESGGGFCCENEKELYRRMHALLANSKTYQAAAEAARQVILKNLGASARTVKEILESL